MAKQLGTVAYNLINDVEEENNNARRRRTMAKKMEELKSKIKKFHDSFKSDVLEHVLEDAEKQQLKDEDVKNWLGEVKDVYYQVIDVCQELRMEETRKSGSTTMTTTTSTMLPLFCPSYPPQQYRVRDEILQMADNIMQKIESIMIDDKKVRYKVGIKPKSSKTLRDQQPTQTFVYDENILKLADSREEEKRKIIPRICHYGEKVMLVCIRGMGGIGKSALAREVYKQVKNDFHVAAIVDVSAEFDPNRIARDFVEWVTSIKINKNELESLPQKVDMSIKGKRFLLVLDGVRDDVKDLKSKWDKLIGIFKAGGRGCTILMTTTLQKKNVVVKTSHYDIKLPKLSEKDCWSIILDQAFGVQNRNPHIVDILYKEVGIELVKKCEGLPVIAQALGDVLRDRTSESDWKQVLKSDVWEFAPANELGAMKATMLRYHLVLPPDLKPCLLYCSIFPRNHRIDVDQLINLWMSQDSIGLDDRNMEAEGWKRFRELLNRSIFEDCKMQSDSGGFECKLQGAMCDFIRNLTEKECHILHLENKKDLKETVRHCSVYIRPQDSLPSLIPNSKNLHTLMVLSEYVPSIDPKILSSLLSEMRRLRALVLSYCSIKELPTKACELLHLRYLDLSFNRDLKKLPEEISNLWNLQTLNLNGCDELQELPKTIGKLTKLRHLDILWTTNLSYLPKGLTKLVSLKRLSRFFGTNNASNKACNLSDMKHLTNLHGYITIEGLGGSENGVPSSEVAKNAELKKKVHIIGLELWFSVMGSESNHEEVLKALEAPTKLECLGIFYYRGKSFSSCLWIQNLEKLKHLILSDCGNCDTLPSLGTLQFLETLEIRNLGSVNKVGLQFLGSDLDSYSGKVAFPKLKRLRFQKMDSWETWEDGTDDVRNHMENLSFLLVENCFMLRTLPNYIKQKTNLEITEPGKKIIWSKTDPEKEKLKTTIAEAEPGQKILPSKLEADKGVQK